MITRRDLDEQIEYIKGKINQTPEECVKLAAYYIIRDHPDAVTTPQAYGDAPPPAGQQPQTVIGQYGDAQFFEVIAGKDAESVWKIIGETMATLQVMEPRLYAGIIRKIQAI